MNQYACTLGKFLFFDIVCSIINVKDVVYKTESTETNNI